MKMWFVLNTLGRIISGSNGRTRLKALDNLVGFQDAMDMSNKKLFASLLKEARFNGWTLKRFEIKEIGEKKCKSNKK